MKYMVLSCMVLLLTGCSWMYALGGDEKSDFDISEAGMQITSLEFLNQEGETQQIDEFTGDYWLANMIFTHCPEICPIMSPNMQNLQATAIEEGIPLQIVSFSVDPERDTPEILKQYGSNLGVDYESWTFATGYEQDEIETFSVESFKSPVQKLEDGSDILHNTSFFLVDPEGLIIRKYDGLEVDQEEIVKDLKEAVETE
ncbi:SCO family protein [Alkalicoccobacillus murimartini]|uniref:Protein SCO1/2 n=1 Tax=Alkalicoccobacillus murimartini TaxID=171685 RepID=A0ABT9YJA4_9BACI|nr:SCO family protein [Alkalicoccobacillus murimartini]MDQ0207938.1 protein SCO1/2 [Alkalicoccobacillus murimartini]